MAGDAARDRVGPRPHADAVRVASGIILFDWVVPPRLGLAMEFCVAIALVLFGAGTLVGMTVITTGLVLPVATVAHRWQGGQQLVRVATGAMSVAMGMWLVYEIGWSDGLFLAAPTWTPR